MPKPTFGTAYFFSLRLIYSGTNLPHCPTRVGNLLNYAMEVRRSSSISLAVGSVVTDVSSEQIAEEDRHIGGASLLAAQSRTNLNADGLDSADSVSSSETKSLASPTEASVGTAPSATQRLLARWNHFPGPTRRLVLWASAVTAVSLMLRAGDAVQPVFVPPQERFEKFVETVKQRLPAILYGTDPFGQPLLPVEVQWEITPSTKSHRQLFAVLTFEDASFSSAGHVLYTRYKIDYRWQRDHWECHNLKCDVERPELTKLDQMDFNAVLAHESAEKNLELVKLKRAQAEALLKPNLPLGELLRSADLY